MFPVVDAAGKPRGAIVFEEVKGVSLAAGIEGLVVARDMARERMTFLSPDTDLEEALRLLVEQGVEELPVYDGGTPVGFLKEQDLLSAYRKEVLRRRV